MRQPLLLLAATTLLLAQSGGPVFTDSRQLPRDYKPPTPVKPAEPAIVGAADIPWTQVQPGLRRKVYFNDRLTLAVLEFTRSAPDDKPVSLHYHVHDQTTYVLEGRILAVVDGKQKEIGAGGVFIAPSNKHHGVRLLTDKVVLLDAFTPTREDFRP
jgi:mannose-6-phosphate isomerase-like protein (cupin superfamily)